MRNKPAGMMDGGDLQVVEAVRRHPLFARQMSRLSAAEADRVYCRHGYDHLLAVARIAYARVLELGLPYSKQVVYAAALLHDVGKADQYETGTPHELEGARLADMILRDLDVFTAGERDAIVKAVREHRRYSESASDLGKVLFAADKASRLCFDCDVRDTCGWSREKMNLEITA